MRWVTARNFKRLAGERIGERLVRRRELEVLGVIKQHLEPPAEAGPDRRLRFTISTGAVDRDQDIIDPAGWSLDHYRKNPVVLWAHNADVLPIGKVVDLVAPPDRLLAEVEFLPEGYGAASDFADQVYRMAKDGWLAATSVGFRPIRWDFTSDKERGAEDWFPGVDYHEQELVELSLVSVPANPEALIEPGLVQQPAAADYRASHRRLLERIDAITDAERWGERAGLCLALHGRRRHAGIPRRSARGDLF